MSTIKSTPSVDPDNIPSYIYKADVVNITDGDTFRVRIDLGFDTHVLKQIRTRDIDTREISFTDTESEEYKRGRVHALTFARWVGTAQRELQDETDWPFYAYSHEYERGAYGRVIGDIWSRHHNEWASRFLFNEFDDVSLYDDA